jgi:hypothetical protein
MADKAEKHLIWQGMVETPNNCALVEWWFSAPNPPRYRLLAEIDFVHEPPSEEDVATVDQAVRDVAAQISEHGKVTYVGSVSATARDLEVLRDRLLDPEVSS